MGKSFHCISRNSVGKSYWAAISGRYSTTSSTLNLAMCTVTSNSVNTRSAAFPVIAESRTFASATTLSIGTEVFLQALLGHALGLKKPRKITTQNRREFPPKIEREPVRFVKRQ